MKHYISSWQWQRLFLIRLLTCSTTISRPTTSFPYIRSSCRVPQLVSGQPRSVSPVSDYIATGKHLRHARDHFTLLLECMSTPPPYIMSYDVRIRNTPMETSRSGAKDALLETIKQLDDIVPGANLGDPVTLHAITPYMHEFQTTVGREVSNPCRAQYCLEG